jgi:methionyl-tRNA formyltransferase
MRILVLGGTDLTLATVDALRDVGLCPVGLVGVGRQFQISYSGTAVPNVRHADLEGWAVRHDVAFTATTKIQEIEAFSEQLNANFCLVIGWYHMVPARLRSRFMKGCAAVHASLLPDLRGGAPLNWAILLGRSETGVTMFELGDGVDDGPIYAQQRIAISAGITIAELVRDAEKATLDLVKRYTPEIFSGRLKPRPQIGTPTYSLQRVPEDGRIDWTMPVLAIDRLVRAVGRPYPGAFTFLEDRKVLVLASCLHGGAEPEVYGAPGQICRLADRPEVWVVTGARLLGITEALYADTREDALPALAKSVHKRFRQT